MNDDLISRAAAIDSVEIFLKQTDAPEVYPGLIPALARVINNVPSAQQVRTQMSSADDLISRTQAIDGLSESLKRVFPEHRQIAEKCLKALPSAEPEHMHTVMLKIKEKYEKAMNTPCINNPIAWALYQTWKEYDR